MELRRSRLNAIIGVVVVSLTVSSAQRNCSPLTKPENGAMSGSGCQGAVSGSCHFTCNDGYRHIGFKSLKCLVDGTWTSSVPKCYAPSCPELRIPPGMINNGQCRWTQPGGVCTYRCLRGQLSGIASLACRADLTWSSALPSCIGGNGGNAVCPSLSSPQNGIASGVCAQARHTQQCVFSCYQGYRLLGQGSLQCLGDGLWSSATPTCIR